MPLTTSPDGSTATMPPWSMRKLRAARLLLALLALTAIGYQLLLQVRSGYSTVNFFSYFTNLANIYASFALIFSALSILPGSGGSRAVVRYISVVNMTLVGLVFTVLLRNADLGPLLPWVNVVLHYLLPCAVVIDWLVDPPGTGLTRQHLLLALIVPAAYLFYVLLRGASTGWYPYPFLNPANVGGYAGVAAYAGGIAIAFIVAAWSLRAIGNRRLWRPERT